MSSSETRRISLHMIPVVKYRELKRALERQGWSFQERARHRHHCFLKGSRRLTIAYKRGDLDRPALVDAFNKASFTRKEVQDLFS